MGLNPSHACLLFPEWASASIVGLLHLLLLMGLYVYTENIFSHNSLSGRTIPAQKSAHLLGFLDADDSFLTRVEMPIHFSEDKPP